MTAKEAYQSIESVCIQALQRGLFGDFKSVAIAGECLEILQRAAAMYDKADRANGGPVDLTKNWRDGRLSNTDDSSPRDQEQQPREY